MDLHFHHSTTIRLKISKMFPNNNNHKKKMVSGEKIPSESTWWCSLKDPLSKNCKTATVFFKRRNTVLYVTNSKPQTPEPSMRLKILGFPCWAWNLQKCKHTTQVHVVSTFSPTFSPRSYLAKMQKHNLVPSLFHGFPCTCLLQDLEIAKMQKHTQPNPRVFHIFSHLQISQMQKHTLIPRVDPRLFYGFPHVFPTFVPCKCFLGDLETAKMRKHTHKQPNSTLIPRCFPRPRLRLANVFGGPGN